MRSKTHIKVLGLNPHAGDGGYIGKEENEIIEPVITKLNKKGLNLKGPISADTAFIEKNEKIKKQVEAKISEKRKRHDNLLSFEKEIKFINPQDDKKGRSLVDRPDTNSDYKIHVMYILPKESKDKEMDINGKLEKMVFQMDDMFFKATSNTKKNKAKGQ